MTSPATTDLTASFLIAVPPGWVRFPAAEDARAELERTVDAVIARAVPADLPRDKVEPWRREMRRRLVSTVVDAGDAGATAAYLPVQQVNGFVPPMSIVESELDDESETDAAEVIARTLADAGAIADGLRDVDGAAAARTETTVERVQPAPDMPVVTDRQVVYTIGVPHRPGRWVVMSCSVIAHPDSDPALTEALVGLFDALMTTFRWVGLPDGEPSDLERRMAELSGADA